MGRRRSRGRATCGSLSPDRRPDDRERDRRPLDPRASPPATTDTRRYIKQGEAFVFEPATFAPPVITTARAGYTFVFEAGPDAVLTYNDFAFENVSARHDAEWAVVCAARHTSADTKPTAYFGFELPPASRRFPIER